MKKQLIIIGLLLAVSLSGFGQSDSINEWMILYGADSIVPISYEDLSLKELIAWADYDFYVIYRLQKEYIDYCYADSSIKYQYMKVTWDGMGWDTTYTLSMYPIMMESSTHKIPPIYQHRTPTFKGYVKWLEKLIQ